MPIQVEHEGQTITVYTEAEHKQAIDDEVAGLKVTNQQLKEEKRELADKIKTIDEEKRQAEEEKAKRDGDYEKLERLMAERQQEQREQYEKLVGDIRKEKVGSALNDVVTRLGAGGTRNEDLRDLLKTRFEFDYDNESGKVTVSGDGITSLEQLEKTIQESGRYDAYLAGSQASGGGSPGSQGGGAAGKKLSDMSEKERIEFKQRDPEGFRQALANR
ncbi:hypothetical protein [Halomonas sp. DN3]|uniref:hypothetical protein n=1 Tax=Halomonas sp. DN3 TaxID=2953657 RepID=UPI0020A150B3|nr:hypothetical protein [Halomonas sp. DN3]USZ48126.1 hypothetical protein NKF27_11355 [Halomonas sp. DN3]